ncbi:hypothetical protein KR222_011168 [Zaprionus bogoriensis]|nr:hypothetical protein KR222_011168 [Zaprionus bogoriensis]
MNSIEKELGEVVKSDFSETIYNPLAAKEDDYVRVGILPLRPTELDMLMQAIADTIISTSMADVKPRFVDYKVQAGCLMLVCLDNSVANWLRDNFGQIKAKCSLDIKLLEGSPSPVYIKGEFPNSSLQKNEDILSLLDAQNDFTTTLWKVVQRSTKDDKANLVIMIDDASLQWLKELDGKVWYKLGRITLILDYVMD